MGLLGMVRNLQGGGLTALASNHVAVTATMTAATWNTAASHDAADAADIQFGVEGATNGIIGATGAAGKGGVGIAANELWYDTSPATVYDTTANAIMDYVINGLDIGYEITGAALTGGVLVFHCVWEPLNGSGLVEAGAGGAL